MQEKLEKALREKYPTFLSSMQQPIWAGDGWYDLLDVLISSIIFEEKNYPDPTNIVAVQIKSKFGGLRFYTTKTSPKIIGMIQLAEALSFKICEDCGAPGICRGCPPSGWRSTICNSCYELMQKKNDV